MLDLVLKFIDPYYFHGDLVAVQNAVWYVYPIIDWALLVYEASIVRSF